MKRVRLMRDSILKRRTRIDEVQVKGPSRELARLQTCQEKADAQHKAWLENLEHVDDSVPVNVCTFCGRRFERRVVLLSHSKVCQHKHKPAEAISITKKAAVAVVDEEQVAMDTDTVDTNGACWSTSTAALDDSSNSNSNSADTEVQQSLSVNKRKRGRAAKVNMKYESNETEVNSKEIDVNDEETFDSENIVSTTGWSITGLDSSSQMKSTNGEKSSSSRKCKYCDKNFSNPSNLRRHITMLHVRQRKFCCSLCKTFKALRKADVVQHIQTTHDLAKKKGSISEYIFEQEEILSNIQTSQNRRKEKHFSMLKDDDSQAILGTDDMEANSNDILDAISDNANFANSLDESIEDGTPSNHEDVLKGKGRTKSIVKRRLSQKSEQSTSAESNLARRPVRNRTMPVKKDFVYDLSNLLKKDTALYSFKDHQPAEVQDTVIDRQPPKKRRNTIPDNNSAVESEKRNDTDEAKVSPEIVNKLDDVDATNVKGAANVMAELAVNNNRAIFSKPPKLPTERPISRTLKAKSFDAIRNWPILKRPMRGNIKSKTSNLIAINSFRHALKRKKCFAGRHSADHISNGISVAQSDKTLEKPVKISTKIANKIKMNHADSANEKAMPTGTENRSTKEMDKTVKSEDSEQPKRRMTLLERLAENKTKKMKESMTTVMQNIQKEGNDSDENSD